MIVAGLTLPRTSGPSSTLFCLSSSPLANLETSPSLPMNKTDYSLFYYFLFWAFIFTVSLTFIFIYGIDYVAWPRLIPPTDVIHYDGPGYRSANKGKGFGLNVGRLKEGAGAKWLAKPGMRRGDRLMEEIELGTKKRMD